MASKIEELRNSLLSTFEEISRYDETVIENKVELQLKKEVNKILKELTQQLICLFDNHPNKIVNDDEYSKITKEIGVLVMKTIPQINNICSEPSNVVDPLSEDLSNISMTTALFKMMNAIIAVKERIENCPSKQ